MQIFSKKYLNFPQSSATIKNANRGETPWRRTLKMNTTKRKGRKKSEETKQKMRESSKGEKNGMWGKNHTEEAKQKISEKLEEINLILKR